MAEKPPEVLRKNSESIGPRYQSRSLRPSPDAGQVARSSRVRRVSQEVNLSHVLVGENVGVVQAATGSGSSAWNYDLGYFDDENSPV